MSGKILLFGFDSLPQILAVEAAVAPMNVELIPVSRADYNKPLAVLAGLETGEEPPAVCQGLSLGGRMMVLCDLRDQLDALLPVLAKAGVGPECLKAVLTPHNRGWNAMALYAELARERQAMQSRWSR